MGPNRPQEATLIKEDVKKSNHGSYENSNIRFTPYRRADMLLGIISSFIPMRPSSLLRPALILGMLTLTACNPKTTQLDNQTASGGIANNPATANVPDYTIEDNFKNVYNIDFLQNEIPEGEARDLLMENKFVVLPKYNDEFFSTYEANRYRLDPNFVTSDSILHTYHLLFGHVLQKTEEEKLATLAKSVSEDMVRQSTTQLAAVKGTSWENAAKRNLAFFAVGRKLIDPTAQVPAEVKTEVDAELALIAAKAGVAESPVMNMGGKNGDPVMTPWGELTPGLALEDYSQYIPRGHYDGKPLLENYFRTMMWYGRQTLRFKNPDEVKSAILMTRALDSDAIQEPWEKLYEITAFFVGESDDLSFPQLKELTDEIYGNDDLKKISGDDTKLTAFMEEAADLPAPKVNSIPVFRADIQADRTAEIKGFRFMGQRFTLDASVMQRLICRDVGTKSGEELCGGGIEGSRMLPSGLDVAAAFGSNEALGILDDMGETDYLHYPENMQKLRTFISGLDVKTWTQNLYWTWLFSIDPLLDVPGNGYPAFMRNTAWVRKQLQTFLGSWTELKHDTILYTKQPYAELGGGGEIPEKDDRGYVEPVPAVYERLALLTAMTRDGLAARNLLPDSQRDNLNRMHELSERLEEISMKELNNESLSDDDYELIRSYGGQIEHLWFEVNREKIDQSGMSTAEYLSENPAAIVADIATDPNGFVKEVATGNVYEIYVLVPVEGRLKLLNGTVYSFYEFPWPMNDRLTDKRWREILDAEDDTTPEQPEWTRSFIAE